ncbi:unnamed protein product [Rotaria magnacalcarata]|uniref:Uncharacterized protein n=1 Tax=Rotaria magnacalcarata TaxID=392030 RepID=A0A815AE82_9BILA|nr:unnamed protein product [Rotaria magnacalcarata]CAF1584101.1 unnamed protein product [Rotaria magnacalcarata]CAF1977678.1 unnamed protein product [Rotaria magnacalcarata]CAF3766709.1 unnamed protein product [Rotaria magnacalcarata]CAF3793926.1 unnamed protein product [Rotaria magnacalcarata]
MLSFEQEIYVAVLLDGTDLARSDNVNKAKMELERIVKFVGIFDDVDECVDYVTNNEDHQILLIVNESDSENIVSVLHEVKQLKEIYVLSLNRSTNLSWIKERNKVRSVITSITSICRILESYKQDDSKQFNFVSSFSASLTDVDRKNEQEVMFMYGQLLKYVLTDANYSERDRIQMIDFLRSRYQHPTDIEKISDFACRYEQMEPIQWYTKGWFLYRDLNQALREHDVIFSYSMRVFIKDLHKQIVNCHAKSKESTIFKVYRGMSIPTTTLDELKKKSGLLLSFNSFLSTTTDESVALIFGGAPENRPHMTTALFEIEVDPSISTPAHYADISDWSMIKDEEEYLFTMCSVFRIQSVEPPDDCNISRIKLLLTDDNDPELTRLTHHIQSDIGSLGIVSFIQLLVFWGKHKEVKELGDLALQTIPEDLKPYLSTILAGCDLELGKREDAIAQLLSVLNIRDEQSHMSRGKRGNNWSKFMLHYAQGKWDLAVENAEALVAIETCQNSESHQELLGMYYMFIGYSRYQQGRNSDALSYTTKAYELLKSSLPATHPHLASCLQVILAIKSMKCPYDQLSTIAKEIIEVRARSLPQEHPQRKTGEMFEGLLNCSPDNYIKFLSQNEFFQTIFKEGLTNTANDPMSLLKMSIVCLAENNINGALSGINAFFETEQGKNTPQNQPIIVLIYIIKADCHRERKELTEAMEFYNKAYDNLKQSLDDKLSLTVMALTGIASIYAAENKFDVAIAVWERCRDMPTSISREDYNVFNISRSKSIANIYLKQAWHYQDCVQYEEALLSFEKHLEIQRTYLEPEHISIARTHSRIGKNYLELQKYDYALSSFQKSLHITQTYHPDCVSDLVRVYKDVGETLELLKKFPDALVHFENALQIQLESLPSTDSNIAQTRIRMGFLYCKLGDADKALNEFGRCLEMGLTVWPVPLAQIARGYFLIGDLYEQKEENLKALSSFQESLRISEICLPIDQLQCANCYQFIGTVLCKLHKFSEALENYKFAMDFQLQVKSPADLSIAALWKNIGTVYAELNNYERAVFAFKASFEIEHSAMPMLEIEALSRSMVQGHFLSKRQHQDPLTNWRQFLEFQASSLHSDHPDLIFTYRTIGSSLSGQNKHADALYNFQRALDIRLKCSSRTDPEVAKDYWYVGINYMLLEQFDNALSSLKTCLSIQTISLPSYHCDLANTHTMIGTILQEQEKLTEALDNYESALKILFQSFSSTNLKTDQDSVKHRNSSLADIYVRIGDIHFKKEHLSEALVNYQLVLDLQLEYAPQTHPMTMHAVKKSGIIYRLLGRYQEALIAYNEYLNLQLITLSPEHIDLAYTYRTIGNMQVKQQQYNEALSSHEKCLLIQTSSLPSNHLQIAYTSILISDLLMKQGKFAQCPAYLDNSLSILLNDQPPREADIAQVRRMIAKVNSKLA